jgi:rubrerythrin
MALLGDPFVATTAKQFSLQELQQAIRADIAGELEAIIGYEAHAMSCNDERVKQILTQIADDEKKHVGQLQQVLHMLNPREKQMFDQGQNKIMQQSQNLSQSMQ